MKLSKKSLVCRIAFWGGPVPIVIDTCTLVKKFLTCIIATCVLVMLIGTSLFCAYQLHVYALFAPALGIRIVSGMVVAGIWLLLDAAWYDASPWRQRKSIIPIYKVVTNFVGWIYRKLVYREWTHRAPWNKETSIGVLAKSFEAVKQKTCIKIDITD